MGVDTGVGVCKVLHLHRQQLIAILRRPDAPAAAGKRERGAFRHPSTRGPSPLKVVGELGHRQPQPCRVPQVVD
jgi:hypothetical protein